MQSSKLAFVASRTQGLVIGMLRVFGSSQVFAAESPDSLNARWAGRILQSLENHPRLVAEQAARERGVMWTK